MKQSRTRSSQYAARLRATSARQPPLFLMTFLFVADFKNRTDVLLLMGTVMTCSIVPLGLVALGAYGNRGTLRVLQAIDAAKGSTRA